MTHLWDKTQKQKTLALNFICELEKDRLGLIFALK